MEAALAMPHRSLFVDRVFVVAWRTPVEEDIEVIASALEQRRAQLGRPLLYLSVIGARAIPSAAVRAAMVSFFRRIFATCDSMHVVTEGDEVVMKAKLGFIETNLEAIGAERARVFVANRVADIAAVSPEGVRGEIAAALREANKQRLLEFVGP